LIFKINFTVISDFDLTNQFFTDFAHLCLQLGPQPILDEGQVCKGGRMAQLFA